MKIQFYKILGLSLLIGTLTQGTQAAAMKKTAIKPMQASVMFEKQLSPIEKALSQQKRDRILNKDAAEVDQFKTFNNLKYAPSQNFLADQHKRFSRFVQSIFPST